MAVDESGTFIAMLADDIPVEAVDRDAARAQIVRNLRRLAGIVILVLVVPMTVVVANVHPAQQQGDLWNYLAAGERLNAGHPLYALSPGDRPVDLHPPYWSVPLLSPPFIAVVWRPLALFGEGAMIGWWLGGVIATAVYVAWLLRRLDGPLSIIALVALSPPLALGAVSGNAIAYLVPLLAFRHPVTVAIGAAVRLTPILLARSIGLRRTVVFGIAIAVVSLLGAGVDNHLAWLQSVPGSAPTPISIAGLTGLPPFAVAAVCALLALRGWRWAVVGMTLATPAVYFYTFGLLSLLFVPSPRGGETVSGPPAVPR